MSEFLKCDAEGCDHIEDVDAIVEEMVGRQCPKCGANLLTAADWTAWSKHFAPAISLMKSEGLIDPPNPSGSVMAIRIGFHEGELSFKARPA